MQKRVFVGNNGLPIGSVLVSNMSVCTVIPPSQKIFDDFKDALYVVAKEYGDFFMAENTMQPIIDLYVQTMNGKLDTLIAQTHINILKDMWNYLDDKTYNYATRLINSCKAMGVDLLLLSFQDLNALCRSRKFAEDKYIKNCFISLHPVHRDKTDLSGVLKSSESKSENAVNYHLTYSDLTILDIVAEFYKMFQRGEQ